MDTTGYNWTVCDELVRQGYLTKLDRKHEGRYCLKVIPRPVCALYILIIWPVVMLMRFVPIITPTINVIARFVWIDRAVREGCKLQAERDME